jgi:hypothetical protein
MRNVLFFLFLFHYLAPEAQIIRESELRLKMDQGAELMEKGYYDSAQVLFKVVLQNLEKLPSDMAYYFGRNSYHLRKYKQSINWLNKYIQLKGTGGRFYQPAIRYLQYAEEEYLKIQRASVASVEESLLANDYDCDGLEKMLCPVCHGSGVIVDIGVFNEAKYKTCSYCTGGGYLSCSEYNLFMRGGLKPKTNN